MNNVENVDYIHEGLLTNSGVDILDCACERCNDLFTGADTTWCVVERYHNSAIYNLEVANEDGFCFGLQAIIIPNSVCFTPFLKINKKDVYFNDAIFVRKITYDYEFAISQLLQLVYIFSLGSRYISDESLEYSRRLCESRI